MTLLKTKASSNGPQVSVDMNGLIAVCSVVCFFLFIAITTGVALGQILAN